MSNTEKTEKIIFVGVHNKPGLKPLDSKSVSGKRVDLMIEKIGGNCLKSNLYELDYLPKDAEVKEECKRLWLEKYNPTSDDVIVLLGAIVHKEFPKLNYFRIVKIAHPSLQYSPFTPEQYINTSVGKIFNTRIRQAEK